jgi:predicted nuclease of predicted toxin-antitoxin system
LKLLFDQGTPAPLRGRLPAHSVDTLAEKGWSDQDNGELLEVAEREGYEVLVTTDQSLPYQQNLAGRRIGLVVLLSTDWREVRLRTREIGEAIAAVRPGGVIEVPIRAE